ncbi:MAG: MotA/TolQ/ExbB proton channel family protein [Myxococcales bacterium]|nr:MotA/TolQ/ExbB proton channel family protein [Myxococcales bacterium]
MNFSIAHLWSQMGMVAKGVVIVLIIMSILAIGVTVERFITFRKAKIQSIGYIGSLLPLVSSQGRLREAVGLDQRWQASPVAKVIGSGINEFVRGVESLGAKASDASEFELVVDGSSRTMERVKERQLAGMRKGMPLLATISSSAPFVGLFGTVFGIITAFQGMGDPEKGGGGIASVAAGIAEALIATAVGLGVAIVSVWFYNYFIAKIDDVTIDLDETAGEVLDSMMREARGPMAVAPMAAAHGHGHGHGPPSQMPRGPITSPYPGGGPQRY